MTSEMLRHDNEGNHVGCFDKLGKAEEVGMYLCLFCLEKECAYYPSKIKRNQKVA